MKLTKLKKGVRKLVDRAVYYNVRFRPNGFYRTSHDFVQANPNGQAVCHEVHPNLTSTLTVRKDLFDHLSPYLIYDPVTSYDPDPVMAVQNTSLVVSIPNGRVFTNNIDMVAYIAEDNQLIGDVSYQFNPNRVALPEENTIFKQRYFKKPVRYTGTVFSLLAGEGATNNYGHWLIDVLPRIYLLKRSGLFEQIDWFVVPCYRIDYQIDSLKLLGIEADKIIECKGLLHLQADRLVTSTHPRGQFSFIIPEWITQFLRKSFLKESYTHSNYPPFVYISRRDSSIRHATNEDELVTFLEKYGFQSFTLASLPFVEKVKLFASAKIILTVSGAGLSNLFFCKEGTHVIEIFSKGMVQTAWYNIASSLNLPYHFLVANPDSKAVSEKEGQKEDVAVDIAAVKKILENIISPSDEKTPSSVLIKS